MEAKRRAFLRKWRLRCPAAAASLEEAGDRLLAFLRLPPSQRKSARTTNATERVHEGFKRRIQTQTVQPSAETAAVLLWAPMASGPAANASRFREITMRKVDGWQTLSEKIAAPAPVDLAARSLQTISPPETRRASYSTQVATASVAKHEKAVAGLVKDCDALLTFYDFPAERWDHLTHVQPPLGSKHILRSYDNLAHLGGAAAVRAQKALRALVAGWAASIFLCCAIAPAAKAELGMVFRCLSGVMSLLGTVSAA